MLLWHDLLATPQPMTRGGGRVGEAASEDICPICLDHAFLELPIAVRAAGIPVILHVEDRGVSLVENAFATIVHSSRLNARSVRP